MCSLIFRLESVPSDTNGMEFNIDRSIQDLVTCVICCDLFDDPRLLPCSHTYCRQCIADCASASGGRFSCPLRDDCTVTANQINSLPVNRHVRDLVEVHRKAIINALPAEF